MRKKGKRIIAGILALGALLALGGCGEKAPEQMARDEYLVYKGNLKYDVFSKMEKTPLWNGERRVWAGVRSEREAADFPWEDWETKRGLRNGKDGIGEVLFLYGDETVRYLDDMKCDIFDMDVTLNEWMEANSTHREHIDSIRIDFWSEIEDPYGDGSNTEGNYNMSLSFFEGKVVIMLVEELRTQQGKE